MRRRLRAEAAVALGLGTMCCLGVAGSHAQDRLPQRASSPGTADRPSERANSSGTQDLPVGSPIAPVQADPKIAAAIAQISPEKIHDDIAKLVSFGTRNTLSSMSTDLPQGQGILAAADWIESEFKGISAQCGNCLEVKRDDFTEPGSDAPRARIKTPTRLVNVYAILHGTSENKAAPWTLVTGHYDSRVTDVMDAHSAAPGANDDASGVAVSIECARVLSKLKLTGTIVFVAVAGRGARAQWIAPPGAACKERGMAAGGGVE